MRLPFKCNTMKSLRKHPNTKSGAGFTLVEILVALFGFTVIMFGLITLFSSIFISSNKQSALLSDADQARKLVFRIVGELRNAQTSAEGGYALETALPQTLTFYSNVDGGNDVERLRYFLQNGKIYRGVTKASGNPLVYNLANEKITVVQDNVANGGMPVFFYYDGTYDGTVETPLPEPVNPTLVRFVKIDARIYNRGGVDNTNTYAVTAGGAVRAFKTNLGD